MKTIIRLSFLLALILPSISAFSQKYKNVEDTFRLNKEYLKVSTELNNLNAKLNGAQNDLPKFQSKASNAESNAASAASSSSDQASKATNGSMSDAKAAKSKASRAYNQARDARQANNKVRDLQKKIDRYNADIKKKEKRIGELDAMKAAINVIVKNGAGL